MRSPRRKRCNITVAQVDSLESRTLLASDFGDAPAPYPVTLAENGARHTVTLGTGRFGNTVDTEADGTHSALADADGADDGDGIEFGSLFVDRPGSVRINPQNIAGAGSTPGAKVDAWVDFNQDGDWSDAGEQIFSSLPVVNFQNQFLAINVPSSAVVGYTFARFRISVAGGLSPTGDAPDGEVQDHRVYIGFPPPIIIAPADNADVDATSAYRVTLTWGAVPQAVNYDVWINYGTQNQWHRATVSGTSYTPNQDFGTGIYTLWIRSLASGNLKSAWSDPKVFSVTAQPTIVPMDRLQNTARPTITWAPVLGATQYRLWLSDLTTGQQYLQVDSLPTTSYTPTTDLPLGSYRVWVSIQTPILWSAPVDFHVAPAPILTGGLNPTFDRTPTFAWNATPGAATYEFQLRNMNTGVTVISQIGITTTSFTPSSDLPDGPYRWWVRAKSSANLVGLWTAPTDIYVGGRTTVLTPVGSSNQSIPTFTWRPVDGAVLYNLWVTQLNGPVVINTTINTGATSFVPTTALAAGTYRIWVQAISATNQKSPWSLEVRYTVVARDTDSRRILESTDSVLSAPLLLTTLHSVQTRATTDTPASPLAAEMPHDEPHPVPADSMVHSVEWLNAIDAAVFAAIDRTLDCLAQQN